MLRSMNSAVSGLKNHQTFMDVIGNNISNVNTTGFKASRVTFQTMLSQTLRTASAPTADRGGVNNVQVGLGSAIAGADVVNTQGTLTTTSKLTDLAIQGDGFFVMNDGSRKFYTRDGAFDLGADSTLISPTTGLRVMGWMAQTDAAGNVSIDSTVPPAVPIKIELGQSVAAKPSHNLGFSGNLNGGSTDRVGSGVVESTLTDGNIAFDISASDTIGFTYGGQTYTTAAIGAFAKDTATLASVATAIQTAMNTAIGGATNPITVSVIDDPASLTGEATLSFQAPDSLVFSNFASANVGLNAALRGRSAKGLESLTSSVVAYDSLGNGHDVTIRFDKTNTANTWNWSVASLDAGTTIDSTGTNGAGHGTITFDSDGKFRAANTTDATNAVANASSASVTLDFAGGQASDQVLTLDFSSLTQLQAGNSATTTVNDGFETGTLLSFVVGQDGVITGTYSNGLSAQIAQIALATFPNVGGLNHIGQNLFVESANSGLPNIGAPLSGSRGQINAGQLEASNVDLALQFTDMIRAERGFQANSRIITTSDEMLQDLVNLKR
jgi:flagellar hook protein FlgE